MAAISSVSPSLSSVSSSLMNSSTTSTRSTSTSTSSSRPSVFTLSGSLQIQSEECSWKKKYNVRSEDISHIERAIQERIRKGESAQSIKIDIEVIKYLECLSYERFLRTFFSSKGTALRGTIQNFIDKKIGEIKELPRGGGLIAFSVILDKSRKPLLEAWFNNLSATIRENNKLVWQRYLNAIDIINRYWKDCLEINSDISIEKYEGYFLPLELAKNIEITSLTIKCAPNLINKLSLDKLPNLTHVDINGHKLSFIQEH